MAASRFGGRRVRAVSLGGGATGIIVFGPFAPGEKIDEIRLALRDLVAAAVTTVEVRALTNPVGTIDAAAFATGVPLCETSNWFVSALDTRQLVIPVDFTASARYRALAVAIVASAGGVDGFVGIKIGDSSGGFDAN